jgi:hypothetical protein
MRIEEIINNEIERIGNIIAGIVHVSYGSILTGVAKIFGDKEGILIGKAIINIGDGELMNNNQTYKKGIESLNLYLQTKIRGKY